MNPINSVTPLGVPDTLCSVACAAAALTCTGVCAVDGPLPIADATAPKISVATSAVAAAGAAAAFYSAARTR